MSYDRHLKSPSTKKKIEAYDKNSFKEIGDIMNCFKPGLNRLGGSCSCFDSPQGAIIFSAIIGLLLIEVLDENGLNEVGNIVLTIGQILVTAAELM